MTAASLRPPRFPLLGKVFALAFVLLALAMALSSVSGVVAERQGRLRDAEANVAASLAGAQTLVGPLLERHCSETWTELQGEGKERHAVLARRDLVLVEPPSTLAVDGRAASEPRRRGIYTVHGYVLSATLSARWADRRALVARAEHAGSQLRCGPVEMMVAVGDARGLRSVVVHAGGETLVARAGSDHPAHPRGLHVELPGDADALVAQPLAADVALELVGTGELAFAPVGESSRVALASSWPSPSFGGRFLPVERQVGEHGFAARWTLNALATTAPAQAAAGAPACAFGDALPAGTRGGEGAGCIETFGVSFIDPVSVYTLADRATKYGMLFIALTFVAVAIVEVLGGARVHPIQYLLVGCALAVFFLLLVSLSEHVAFALAYAGAAFACTALLGFYGAFVLGGARRGLAFAAGVAALYAVLWELLQLEQTALLLGALLLFAVIAALMVATRRVDWYAWTRTLRGGERVAPMSAASADAGSSGDADASPGGLSPVAS